MRSDSSFDQEYDEETSGGSRELPHLSNRLERRDLRVSGSRKSYEVYRITFNVYRGTTPTCPFCFYRGATKIVLNIGEAHRL